jgi:hypothetical protein
MITLKDTFNNVTISRHRTLEAAVLAKRKHARAVRKANGENSYVWYGFFGPDGKEIGYEQLFEARERVDAESLR